MRRGTRAQPGASVDPVTLAERLEHTEETLRAIQEYLVDAFVVTRGESNEILTLEGADHPYRAMVEGMNEGAVTLISDGTIFYSNPRFAEMVGLETKDLIGTPFRKLISPENQEAFDSILRRADLNGSRAESWLRGPQRTRIPVQLSIFLISSDRSNAISILITDVSERLEAEQKIRTLASKLAQAEQEERLRISRILHDDLQQRLFAIKAQVCLLGDVIQREAHSEAMKAELGYVDDWLSEAITITRNLSIELIPAILPNDGLLDALNWLASNMKKQDGLIVSVESQEEFPPIEGPLRTLLFQAVRELLFNIGRQNGTARSTVMLGQSRRRAHITVRSEGNALEGNFALNDPILAYGLMPIRDRLELMGCSLKITSPPGKGTRAVIGIPLGRISTPA